MTTIKQRRGTDLFPVRDFRQIFRGTPASTVPGTYFDIETDTVTTSAAWYEWEADDQSTPESGFTYENLTPEICSVANWPLIERVGDGVGVIRMTNRGVTSTFSRNYADQGNRTIVEVTGFVADTVGALSWEILEPLLIEGGDLNLFEPGFTGYNADCWAASFDFTGVAFYYSAEFAPRRAGTAITPRHLLCAWHYQPGIGGQMKFMKADGTVITRTIIGMNRGPSLKDFNANPLVSDRCVVTLDEDLPPCIKVYPVVDHWMYTATPMLDGKPGMVAAWTGMVLDQDRNVLLCGRADTAPVVRNLASASVYGVPIENELVSWYYSAAAAFPGFISIHSAYYQEMIGGDSGSPAFYPLGGSELALAACISGSMAGSFPSAAVLNAIIADADASASVSTGYTVTVAADPRI